MYEVEAGISPTARLPSPGAGSKALLWHTSQMYMYGGGLTQERQRQARVEPSRAQPNTDNHSQAQQPGSRQHDVDNPAF